MTKLSLKELIGALCLVSVASCAPSLLWVGHNPARTNRFELRHNGNQFWVVQRVSVKGSGIFERKSAAFDEVYLEHAKWNPKRQSLAFIARRAQQYVVVDDLQTGASFDGIGGLYFSPDGGHLAYSAKRGDSWLVLNDGIEVARAESIVDLPFSFSPDSKRLGFAVVRGKCAHTLIDGALGPCVSNVTALALGNTRKADLILVKRQVESVLLHEEHEFALPNLKDFSLDPVFGRWAAVVQEGDSQSLLLSGQGVAQASKVMRLEFSPSGALSYVIKREDGLHAVIDGVEERGFMDVGGIVFSDSGKHHAYVGQEGNVAIVMRDGQEVARWSAADGLVFSADAKRLAYAARNGNSSFVVCQDKPYPFDVVVETSLAFTADGQHCGALVGTFVGKRLSIAIDGKSVLPFDSAEFFGAAAEGAAGLSQLRPWVRAEMQRYVEPHNE